MTALGIGLESGLEVIQESKNRIMNVLFSFCVRGGSTKVLLS